MLIMVIPHSSNSKRILDLEKPLFYTVLLGKKKKEEKRENRPVENITVRESKYEGIRFDVLPKYCVPSTASGKLSDPTWAAAQARNSSCMRFSSIPSCSCSDTKLTYTLNRLNGKTCGVEETSDLAVKDSDTVSIY